MEVNGVSCCRVCLIVIILTDNNNNDKRRRARIAGIGELGRYFTILATRGGASK